MWFFYHPSPGSEIRQVPKVFEQTCALVAGQHQQQRGWGMGFCSCCSTAMMFHSRMCHVAAQVVNGLCIIYSCIYLYDRDVELIQNASQFDLTAWSMSFCRMKRLRLLQLPSRRCWSSRRLGPVEVGPTYRHVKSLQSSSVKRMSMMFINVYQTSSMSNIQTMFFMVYVVGCYSNDCLDNCSSLSLSDVLSCWKTNEYCYLNFPLYLLSHFFLTTWAFFLWV